MAKNKKEIRSIHIEPAENGHMVTAHFKSTSRSPQDWFDSSKDTEKTVHEDCCGAANRVHELIGGSDHDIKGNEGEENEE